MDQLSQALYPLPTAQKGQIDSTSIKLSLADFTWHSEITDSELTPSPGSAQARYSRYPEPASIESDKPHATSLPAIALKANRIGTGPLSRSLKSSLNSQQARRY